MMYLTNGTLLQGGKYKIVRFLSSGGFGNTYEAIDVECNKKIAIKEFFMKDSCNRDETTNRVIVATKAKEGQVTRMKEKFMKEAYVLKGMLHPNIVHVENAFEENATAYYVMDYIEGTSLNDIIKVAGSLSEAKAMDYIMQIAEALRYVHSKNILHLDIKPGNIMVDRNGKAILIDFGASKQYDEVTGENTSTLLGINTTGYAPAEQSYRGFVQFSASTDIYALGATLYKLLTGTTPPDAQMLKDGEAELSPLPSNISASVKNAVKEAMRPLRKDRPQSIDEFVKILSDKNDSPKEKRRFENKTKSTSVEDEETIVGSSPNTPPNVKGFREKIYDDPFSKDVDELCKLTGKSKAVCEKALKQTYGNKHVAIFRIQTDILYEKVGSTKLGIDWDTCKRYIENADGSLEKAQKRIKALIAERENAIESLFAYYGNDNDPFGFDVETCRKEYANANYDKKEAEKILFAKKRLRTMERSSTNSEGNFITEYLSEKWAILTDNVFSVIFYLIIFGGMFGFFVYTGERYALSCFVALMLTSAIAWVLGRVIGWLFDEDSGFVEVSKIVYGVSLILVCLLWGLCVFFNIDLSASTPIQKGF